MPNLTLDEDSRRLVLGALDTLGIALAEHNHTWTVGERAIYDAAIAIVGRGESRFEVADDEDDEDPADDWKKG